MLKNKIFNVKSTARELKKDGTYLQRSVLHFLVYWQTKTSEQKGASKQQKSEQITWRSPEGNANEPKWNPESLFYNKRSTGLILGVEV